MYQTKLYNAKSKESDLIALILQHKGQQFTLDDRPPPFECSKNKPVLNDRGHWLLGLHVICSYLDERYPMPPLLPHEPIARARVRMIAEQILADGYRQTPPQIGAKRPQ